MGRSSRRQFLTRGALLAAAAAGVPLAARAAGTAAPPPPPPPPRGKPLRKLLDIGPGGVIAPGSAQDLRVAGNAGYFAETGTRWIRWPL